MKSQQKDLTCRRKDQTCVHNYKYLTWNSSNGEENQPDVLMFLLTAISVSVSATIFICIYCMNRVSIYR